ncbi:MAG: glycosyltransferase family 2 protein [Thermoplasmata archaeon]
MTIRADPGTKDKYIQVIIPAFNESESLPIVLRSVTSFVTGIPVRVLVVDDGSTDGTPRLAQQLGAQVISHTDNRGQGAALMTGFTAATQRNCFAVVSLDADGQHNPSEIENLLLPIINGEADFVIGSRFLGESSMDRMERLLGIRFLSVIVSFAIGQRITDPTNGFRAIRRKCLPLFRLREERFSAPELIVQARKQGLRISEVPVTVRNRHAGQTKKPRIRYLMGLLKALLRAIIG